jgi:hypothetical protein
MTSVVDRPDFPTWGNSLEADFEADTWTFKLCNDRYQVSAGPYALIHNDDYDAMMHEISAARERIKRAENLLRPWLNGDCPQGLDDSFKWWREEVESFFDPEPL